MLHFYLCSHSLVDIELVFLAIMNNAVKIHEQVFTWIYIFISLGYIYPYIL